LDGNDANLEVLWKTQYALTEFTDAANFKSYTELKTKRDAVLGADIRQTTQDTPTTAETVSESEDGGVARAEKAFGNEEGTEETDALSYFEKLANE